jgi:hypothetical protein
MRQKNLQKKLYGLRVVINNGTMPISYTSKEKCKISVFIIVLGDAEWLLLNPL